MKKSDELKSKIADATDRAEAIVNLAKDKDGNDRSLTAEEQTQWSSIMDKDKGELAQLESQLKAALAHESEVARLRAARESTNTPAPVYSPTGRPAGSDGADLALANVRLVSPHMKAFKGPNALADAYDCALWFRAITRKDQAAKDKVIARRGANWFYATQNETSSTDGGYLVPPTFLTALTVYREQVGVSRRLARVIPGSGASVTFAKQTAGTTVYYPAEEGAITASSATFSRVSLIPRKRAVLTYISTELSDDAMVSMMDVVASDMGHQLALQEDKEFVLGDGTSTYGGVNGVKNAIGSAGLVSAATNNDTWPEITYGDLAKAMAAVTDVYQGMPMAWLCSASFKWQVFDRLCLAQGGALSQSMADGVPGAMFAGHPIYVTDRMPLTTAAATLCAVFGSFQNAVTIADWNDVRIDVSEHYAFNTDQIAVRATTRYDMSVHQAGDATNAGAIVGFKTAS